MLVIAVRPDLDNRRVIASAGNSAVRASISVSIAAGNQRAWATVAGRRNRRRPRAVAPRDHPRRDPAQRRADDPRRRRRGQRSTRRPGDVVDAVGVVLGGSDRARHTTVMQNLSDAAARDRADARQRRHSSSSRLEPRSRRPSRRSASSSWAIRWRRCRPGVSSTTRSPTSARTRPGWSCSASTTSTPSPPSEAAKPPTHVRRAVAGSDLGLGPQERRRRARRRQRVRGAARRRRPARRVRDLEAPAQRLVRVRRGRRRGGRGVDQRRALARGRPRRCRRVVRLGRVGDGRRGRAPAAPACSSPADSRRSRRANSHAAGCRPTLRSRASVSHANTSRPAATAVGDVGEHVEAGRLLDEAGRERGRRAAQAEREVGRALCLDRGLERHRAGQQRGAGDQTDVPSEPEQEQPDEDQRRQ